jgi:antitoxin ParD1/3/4
MRTSKTPPPISVTDETRPAEEELEGLLLEGLRSGPATDLTEQDWQDIRREGMARLKARN